MRPTAGRWVSGDDFFDREPELRVLQSHVQDRNHLLLTGQRRMGKTSIARELGRRLEATGWIFLFADVEGSTCAEDRWRPSRRRRTPSVRSPPASAAG